jgi:hypothetical protein
MEADSEPRPRPQLVSHEVWDAMTADERAKLVRRWAVENNCDVHKRQRTARAR